MGLRVGQGSVELGRGVREANFIVRFVHHWLVLVELGNPRRVKFKAVRNVDRLLPWILEVKANLGVEFTPALVCKNIVARSRKRRENKTKTK